MDGFSWDGRIAPENSEPIMGSYVTTRDGIERQRLPPEVRALSIYSLPLGWRVRRALEHEYGSAVTAGDIEDSRRSDIARLPRVGGHSIENLRRSLFVVGHYFRESRAVSELRVDDALNETWHYFGWIEGPRARRPDGGA